MTTRNQPKRNQRQKKTQQKRTRRKHRRRKDKLRHFIDDDDFKAAHYGTPNPVEPDTVSNTNAIIVGIDKNAFEGVATALVNLYIAKGGLEFSPNDSYAYHARIYMTEALAILSEGGTATIVKAPRLFGIIAALLTRRRYSVANGYIVENFSATGNVNVNETVQTGPSGAISKMNYGIKSSTSVLNGEIPLSESPVAYTEDNGLEAIQSLFDYLENRINSPLMKQEKFPLEGNSYADDMSAFAFTTSVLGGGLNGVGGSFKVLASETPIQFPLFACFVPNATVNLARTALWTLPWIGDANLATTITATTYQEMQLKSKRRPNIKYIDFNEIVDTYARFICKVQEKAFDNEDYVTQADNDPNYFTRVLQFPLTFQQMEFVLRAVCMNISPDAQIAGCTVYPTEDTGNANAFRPFVCGNGQGPYSMGRQPLMPQAFAEMLSAGRSVFMDPEQWDKSPKPFLPVYGVFDRDELKPSDYVSVGVYQGEEFKEQCFPTDPMEMAVDMVDFTSGSVIVFGNDSSFLDRLVTLWNTWHSNNAQFIDVLAHATADGGVPALNMVSRTHHVLDTEDRAVVPEVEIYIPGESGMTVEQVKEYKEKMLARIALNKKKEEIQNLYSGRSIIDTTGYDIPAAAIVEGVASCYVVPINKIGRIASPQDNNSIQSMRNINDEMCSITTAQGFARFGSLGELHAAMANRCVRSEHALPTADDALFDQMTRTGGGGTGGDIFNKIGKTLTTVLKDVADTGIDVVSEMV